MSGETPASGREPGLRGSLGRLVDAGFALLRTRAELAALEFAESRDHARDQLLLAAVAGGAVAFAWMGLCAMVVIALWDSYRLGALAGVIAFHLVVAAIAWWRLRAGQAGTTAPFARTLEEFERDRQWLADHFRSER